MLVLCKIGDEFDISKHFKLIQYKLDKDVWEGVHQSMKDNIIKMLSKIKKYDYYRCKPLVEYESILLYHILNILNMVYKVYEDYPKNSNRKIKYDFLNVEKLF